MPSDGEARYCSQSGLREDRSSADHLPQETANFARRSAMAAAMGGFGIRAVRASAGAQGGTRLGGSRRRPARRTRLRALADALRARLDHYVGHLAKYRANERASMAKRRDIDSYF